MLLWYQPPAVSRLLKTFAYPESDLASPSTCQLATDHPAAMQPGLTLRNSEADAGHQAFRHVLVKRDMLNRTWASVLVLQHSHEVMEGHLALYGQQLCLSVQHSWH